MPRGSCRRPQDHLLLQPCVRSKSNGSGRLTPRGCHSAGTGCPVTLWHPRSWHGARPAVLTVALGTVCEGTCRPSSGCQASTPGPEMTPSQPLKEQELAVSLGQHGQLPVQSQSPGTGSSMGAGGAQLPLEAPGSPVKPKATHCCWPVCTAVKPDNEPHQGQVFLPRNACLCLPFLVRDKLSSTEGQKQVSRHLNAPRRPRESGNLWDKACFRSTNTVVGAFLSQNRSCY